MFKKNKKNKPLDLRKKNTYSDKIKDHHRTLEKMEIALDMRLKNRVLKNNEDVMQNNDEISNGLKEIYQINKEGKVDIGDIKKNKMSGFIFWSYRFFVLIVLLFGAWLAFNYYTGLNRNSDGDVLFTIDNKKQVTMNEEFLYTIKYKNLSNVNLENAEIRVRYPDNFIFIDSVPKESHNSGDYKVWHVGKILSHSSGEIQIKGKIINKNNSNILLAEIVYHPDNFSGNLKKEVSSHITLEKHDWKWNLETPATILVNETEDMSFSFNLKGENYLHNFVVDINTPRGMTIMNISPVGDTNATISKINDSNSWQLSNLNEENKFKMQFKFTEKPGDNKNIEFKFKKEENGEEYVFLDKKQNLEVIKSDLDLVLVANGSSENKPVNFGDKINYSISYTNKGEMPLKNISIMAVLDSNFLDWTTLKDENSGIEKGNAIIWTKNEIPQLADLDVGESGNIDFSINVAPFVVGNKNLDKNASIESYAQFSVRGNSASSTSFTDISKKDDNRSNIIINEINSDLSLKEGIRYFNDDNIPVGTGPLPPKVGEKTSFKVYWTIKNNLHELGDIKVVTKLPEYINWNGKQRTSVGDISYDKDTHSVIWDVGKLPLAIYRADAEFSIDITPSIEDKNKILIFLTGSEISAIDMKTNAKIVKHTTPKTSKLEGDEIAQSSSDGRVVE